jgi:hypothetical protein
MAKNIRNLVLFKLGWIACVFFAAAGEPLMATLAVGAVVAAHLYLAPVVVKEAMLLAAAAVIGMAWESLLVFAGIVSYPGYAASMPLAPYWIVAMWVLFATTINFGMRWAKRDWRIAAVAGLVGGPLAFLGGAGMGAVEFGNTTLALAVIGAGWAILLPTLALVADTITDSAWLEAREDAPVAQRRGVSGYVPAARPVPVPVYEKESNRVR